MILSILISKFILIGNKGADSTEVGGLYCERSYQKIVTKKK